MVRGAIEDSQQVVDAGADLGGGAVEDRVAVLAGVTSGGRVGDAPADQLWTAAEVGADFAESHKVMT